MAIQPVTMNKISSVTPAPASAAVNSSANNDTKNIQTQITSKQQHLKKISSDNTITATEKEEKRRQLQKEIDELNRKLEQEKQEQEKKAKELEKKQAQANAVREDALKKAISDTRTADDSTKAASANSDTSRAEEAHTEALEADAKEKEQKRVDMSIKDIQKMLSADYFVQKERVQEQVDNEIENTIHILESEIKQDKSYGTDTSKKEADLESLQEKQNFWTDAQKQTEKTQKQTQEQTAVNANAKVVIDQI